MTRGSCFGALLTSALLVACGETHVTLLEPIVGVPDAGAPIDAALGADASSAGGSEGVGDAGSDGGSDAATSPPLHIAHLIHRYSFDGEGTQVVDSVGSADGSLLNGAVLDGAGHVTLDGKDDYVNLPNRLLSGLTDATLVAWLAWSGGHEWQRVFDFGSTDAGEDMVGNATSSLFLTPMAIPGPGPSTSFQTITQLFGSVDSETRFPELRVSVIAAVVDATNQELRLYAAGMPLGKPGVARSLALLSDDNNWLGRSQWIQDTYLRGTYDEFRIYDKALSDAELAALESAGADVLAP